MLATVKELEALLGRKFDDAETETVRSLLEVASDEVRSTIGQHVAPTAKSTFRAHPDPEGVVMLPQHPVVAVESVTAVDGAPVEFEWVADHVKIDGKGPVEVTFEYGYAEVPPTLRHWALVLAAGVLRNLELGLGPSVAGLSSVSIDDFRAAFADGGDKSGMHIPALQAEQLRERYGPPGVVVVSMR